MREYCLGSEVFNSLVEKRQFECSGLCLVSLVLNPVGTVTGGGEFLHVVVFEFGSIARGVFFPESSVAATGLRSNGFFPRRRRLFLVLRC